MTVIRPMLNTDVSLLQRLKDQAGWNQTPADLRRFIALEPDGCFAASVDGGDVGTVTTCVFEHVAWIAMVLVDQAMRGRGLGKALMNHALDYLDGRGVASIRLDATPLGRPLYEKLGFVAQFEITRFAGSPAESRQAALSRAFDDDLLALDQRATATPRAKLLRTLAREQPDAVRSIPGEGYLLSRPGSTAAQIGPCIASPDAGQTLLRDAFARYAGQPVFIDIPTDNRPAVACAAAAGLSPQRTLTRMTRGPLVEECVAFLWASSGPEKG